MPSSLEVILVPTFMIIVGLMLKRLSILESSDSKLLTKIVLNISLPALIFVNLSKADITGDMLIYVRHISIADSGIIQRRPPGLS